ncbi:MAG: hypothetical protein KDB80_11270 [Planctomycetes bacterium]|nr:hypothetical protein [Planctomycetota bacterium]
MRSTDVYFNTFDAIEVPSGCGSGPAPVAAGALSASSGFRLDGSALVNCSGSQILLVGSCAQPPIALPTWIGCGTCSLAIFESYGAFSDPLVVGPGLDSGFGFCVQSACVAGACIELSSTLAVVLAN